MSFLLRNYTSICHATSNEDGEEQLTLEYETGFHRMVYLMFKNRTLKVPAIQREEWIVEGTRWIGKYSRNPADDKKQFELFEAKGYVKRLDWARDFGLKV